MRVIEYGNSVRLALGNALHSLLISTKSTRTKFPAQPQTKELLAKFHFDCD